MTRERRPTCRQHVGDLDDTNRDYSTRPTERDHITFRIDVPTESAHITQSDRCPANAPITPQLGQPTRLTRWPAQRRDESRNAGTPRQRLTGDEFPALNDGSSPAHTLKGKQMRLIAKLSKQDYEKVKNKAKKAKQEVLHTTFVGRLCWATYKEETKLKNGERLTALERSCRASSAERKADDEWFKISMERHHAFKHWMNVWNS